MDKYIEGLIKEYNTTKKYPRLNPTYQTLMYKKRIDSDPRTLHKKLLSIPSYDPFDPEYKKMVYVRYADDWVIGIRGSYRDTSTTKEKIKDFLMNELGLEINEKKTLITNTRMGRINFLGVKFFKTHHNVVTKSLRGRIKRSPLAIRFEAPFQHILSKLQDGGFIKESRPVPKYILMSNTKDQIIHIHNAVVRGLLNYYSFVHNFGKLAGLVSNILKGSCAMLLATKFSLKSQAAVYKKFGKNLKGNDQVAFIQVNYKIST